MDVPPDGESKSGAEPMTAVAYRQTYQRRLMVLTTLRGEIPATDEMCRLISVDTLAPSLWVTARFLDGSKKSFRPEKIRPAKAAEEQAAEHQPA